MVSRPTHAQTLPRFVPPSHPFPNAPLTPHETDSTLPLYNGHGFLIQPLLPQLFCGLVPEQKILEDYLRAKGDPSLEALFHAVFVTNETPAARPRWLGPALGDEKAVLDLDDVVCDKCALGVLEEALKEEWPRMMKEDQAVRDLLPGAQLPPVLLLSPF